MVSDATTASASRKTQIALRLRRETSLDGLIFFSQGLYSARDEFVSLAIRNGFLELRFGSALGMLYF